MSEKQKNGLNNKSKTLKIIIISAILLFAGTFYLTKHFTVKELHFQKKQKLIAIQPFESFPESLCLILDSNIKNFYHCQTIILPPINLPPSSYYKARDRYRADSIIRYLRRNIPEDCHYIIGLTRQDISVTNGNIPDYGIFGLGFCPGKSCVVSTYRYRKNVSEQLFHKRFLKVCLHELGHNMGLPHCKSQNCMMQDAEGKISTVDQEVMKLCNKCESILSLNIF